MDTIAKVLGEALAEAELEWRAAAADYDRTPTDADWKKVEAAWERYQELQNLRDRLRGMFVDTAAGDSWFVQTIIARGERERVLTDSDSVTV